MKKVLIIAVATALAVAAWGAWVYEGQWRDSFYYGPHGIAVGPNGWVYVVTGCGYMGRPIKYYTATGSLLGSFERSTSRCIWRPDAAARAGGYVYGSNANINDIILYWTTTGSSVGYWHHPAIGQDVDVSPDGTVYAPGDGWIWRYDSRGSILASWAFPYCSEWAQRLAVAPNGTVYVGARYAVYRYNPSGSLLGSWGKQGSGPGQFDEITALDFAPDGTVFVCEGGANDRVQYLTARGSFLGAWGSKGSGPGEFNRAYDIKVSPTGGRVYVCEFTPNSRVQYFKLSNPAVSPASLGRVKALFK